jgi:3,4-dihydroxy 2-butanone 4-phosphate synthase/GTP cyclohydrolase II
MATPDAINFMAKHGRGLICLRWQGRSTARPAADEPPQRHSARDRLYHLDRGEGGRHHRHLAADRARTISSRSTRQRGRSISSRRARLPLVARDGGVLIRAGHTEAAVDIRGLAGLNPPE